MLTVQSESVKTWLHSANAEAEAEAAADAARESEPA